MVFVDEYHGRGVVKVVKELQPTTPFTFSYDYKPKHHSCICSKSILLKFNDAHSFKQQLTLLLKYQLTIYDLLEVLRKDTVFHDDSVRIINDLRIICSKTAN